MWARQRDPAGRPSDDLVHRRFTAEGIRFGMVELEVAALGAPAPVLRDIPALPAVALPRPSLDLRRDVPGTRLHVAARPRARGRRELPLLDLSQEQRERASEDLTGIAVRDLPAEQVLQPS